LRKSHKASALLLPVLFREALRLRKSVIAVEPGDDPQRPVDRVKVAFLEPIEEREEHLFEPGDLQAGEVFRRREPAVAQFLTQHALDALPSQPFRHADFIHPGACDEGSENPLCPGHP